MCRRPFDTDDRRQFARLVSTEIARLEERIEALEARITPITVEIKPGFIDDPDQLAERISEQIKPPSGTDQG